MDNFTRGRWVRGTELDGNVGSVMVEHPQERSNQILFIPPMGLAGPEADANATRVTACVNALADQESPHAFVIGTLRLVRELSAHKTRLPGEVLVALAEWERATEPRPADPVSIWDVAVSRGVSADSGGASLMDFWRVGLEMIGGCETCGASISAGGAYPSKSGFWRCRDCIGDSGFASVPDFESSDG